MMSIEELQTFEAELIGTTNAHVTGYVGEVRKCYTFRKMLFLERKDGHVIKTSEVKEINHCNELISIKTKNSSYDLKVCEGKEDVKNI